MIPRSIKQKLGLSLPMLVIALFLAIFPLVNKSNYIQNLVIAAMMYAVIASNWDLSLGYGGIFNWAHISFFGVAAYVAGIAVKSFGIPHIFAFLIAIAAAVVLSVLACLPVLRIRGIYVCLVTFAFGQLCLHVIMSLSKYTGGAKGLVLIPEFTIGGFAFSSNGKIGFYYFALIIFLASTVFLRWLVKSNFGLSVVALRDFEQYAISRGVPLSQQRLLTFAASAIFTGAVGAFYAFYYETASPDLFTFGYLATILSMLLLGGISTIYGPILGAFALTFVSEFLIDLGPWRYIILSLLMIAVLLFYPAGAFSAIQKGQKQIQLWLRRAKKGGAKSTI